MTPALRRQFWYRHLPFLLLFLLGALVRFYQLEDRPWDSDELGALFRAQQAADFATHVNQGVRIDGHPALVQTFLWYNEQVWKSSPLQLKYLWSTISLVSICFFYGYFWLRSGRKIALLTSSLLLLLWWPVSIGIWVRPYTIAFLWLGILVFSSAKVERSRSLKHLWLILAGISLALIAYSHYMAALTAIFFLLGEVYLRKLHVKQLFIIGSIAGILFLPHTDLFFKQFSEGGLSWLAEPNIDFLPKHIYFLLNGSKLITLTILLVVVFGIFWYRIKPVSSARWTFAFTQIAIWLGVFTVAFLYSIWRKPVLQNNAMYFALPFLIGGFSVFTYRFPSMFMRFFQIILVGLLLFSLTNEKQFYGIGKIDRYAHPMAWFHEHQITQPIYLDGPSDVLNFHWSQQFSPSLSKDSINNLTILPSEPTDDWLTEFDSSKNRSGDTLWVSFHAGTSMKWQTFFWSNYELLMEPTYKNQRYLFPGGELFKAKKSDKSYLKQQPDYTLNLESDKPQMLSFAKLTESLGPIKANDYLVVSVESLNKEIIGLPFDLVSALFQEGFNKALHQLDYRHSSNRTLWNQHIDRTKGLTEIYHPIKLADIVNWDEKSLLRISFEYRGTIPLNEPVKVKARIRKISGNPNLYQLPTFQSIF